jgi:hypothetical protein
MSHKVFLSVFPIVYQEVDVMAKQKATERASREDIGAAMMVWYDTCIKEYPEGLVTQAQAAEMLRISRVAVSRLVTRGYLRAVYFPKPPDIVGIAVGHDDPMWLKIGAWLGDWDQTYAFPKAVFVSFGDVKRLWESGDARRKCKRDWREIMAALKPTGTIEERKALQEEYRQRAEAERHGENQTEEQKRG